MESSKRYEVVVLDQADLETMEAFQYYELQLPGLGERFLKAVEARYEDIATHPERYSILHDDPERVLRDVLVKRFPYTVVFEIRDQTVVVYSIHHTSKNEAG